MKKVNIIIIILLSVLGLFIHAAYTNWHAWDKPIMQQNAERHYQSDISNIPFVKSY